MLETSSVDRRISVGGPRPNPIWILIVPCLLAQDFGGLLTNRKERMRLGLLQQSKGLLRCCWMFASKDQGLSAIIALVGILIEKPFDELWSHGGQVVAL